MRAECINGLLTRFGLDHIAEEDWHVMQHGRRRQLRGSRVHPGISVEAATTWQLAFMQASATMLPVCAAVADEHEEQARDCRSKPDDA